MIENKLYSRLRRLSNIQRLLFFRRPSSYSVAEHSFHVLNIFIAICKEFDVDCDAKDYELVLNHDALESVSSDLPYVVKNLNDSTKKSWENIENELLFKFDELKEYTDANLKSKLKEVKFNIFKLADIIELMNYIEENYLPNTTDHDLKELFSNCRRIFDDLNRNFTKIGIGRSINSIFAETNKFINLEFWSQV